MSRIPPIYSPEQREAIYRLIHEDGKTAVEAVAAAAEGVYGLEPFEMPANSASQIAKRERVRREEQALAELDRGSLVDRLHAARLRIFSLHHDCVQEFKKENNLAEGRFDHEWFRWLVRHQDELEKLARKEPPRSSDPSLNAPHPDQEWLDSLQAQMDTEEGAAA